MKVTRPLLASLALAAAMAVFAFVTAARVPADAVLPTHWDASGTPDAFSPALWALLMPAGLAAITSLILAIIPRIEPLQDKLEGSAPLLRAAWIGIMLLFVIIQATIGLPAYGIDMPVNAIMLGIGVMLVMLGNALPKSRPGFFVGIRTPWAIMDADNWIATHRLGGKLMMLAGLVIIVTSLAPVSPEVTAIVVLVSVFGAALVPFGYSWWLWQKGRGSKA
ncbi:SdpI family protein [Qipengyuania aurantiaca]|uniref:SdpI family protein n=1 Tax=Qipengyuania aurantiaca TaxID=2867233 RepID=A0ABX8ZR84_9SPHN|nr:SdpI family protein [Qipengyuania aurantiaca]QZD90082.1 SdpI family protein [Qipengyuania aurantiaca]